LEATVKFTDVDSSGFYPLQTRDNINFYLGGSEPLQISNLLEQHPVARLHRPLHFYIFI